MCHHYRAAANLPAHFVEEFSLRADQRRLIAELAEVLPDRGAWPLSPAPALRLSSAEPTGELEAFAGQWGLLPAWWKPSERSRTRQAFQRGAFNARGETAATKPAFRDAFRKRRCLLPVSEFFERGHYFRLRGESAEPEAMAFAGLWESWRDADQSLTTVTLLTTEPSSDIRAVGHERMPVLLATPARRRAWLVGEDEGLVAPLADGLLDARRAPRNEARAQQPEAQPEAQPGAG